MNLLASLLGHPLTKSLSVDDPRTTEIRYEIIQGKPFLKKIYQEWYKIILDRLGSSRVVLEIGSGAGFFKDFFPTIIRSEILQVRNVDLVTDATQLPFSNNSLDAIVMTDVLHHIPNAANFFSEASRCLRPGGKVLMIEPWPTFWSKFVYQNFHSEPFDISGDWTIPSSGPLSGANGALPWILFERDRVQFEDAFPLLRINQVQWMMPFVYLLSGGVSLRFSLPGFVYPFLRRFEQLLNQKRWAMFSYIEINTIAP